MKAILALEDGSIFEGRSFTGSIECGGEVIFNTGMTGYQEVLTDPSYTGQMVTMTYPLIGNYGINPQDMESSKIHLTALITKECCKQPSNWRSTLSLPQYLQKTGIPGVEGIDTRALTRHIRIHGAMRGFISTTIQSSKDLTRKALALPSMQGLNLASQVATERPYIWTQTGPHNVDLSSFSWQGDKPKLLIYDYGIKWNIHRLLAEQGFEQLTVPPNFSPEEVNSLAPDAIFLSNGPGDPAVVPNAAQTAKILSDTYPIAGICLGHQILGLAMGATSYKLDFGHHGSNHPVMDMETEKIEISSQNHGFCVDISGLDYLKVTHKNLNDGTLEGFAHKDKPLIAIQFHPEAAPGPHDSAYFFKRFRNMI